MDGIYFGEVFVQIPTDAKVSCGWDCDSTHSGMEVPIVNTDTTRPTRWPCHNPCEQCCPYYFYVVNWRDGHKIKEIQICTDRGCGATPTTPLHWCEDTTVFTKVQDRSSHICMFCSNIEFHEGLQPAFWIEPIDSCPRVQPTGIGGDTTLTGIRDSLCIRNCLKLAAPGPSSQLRYTDSLRIHLGLTGDCKKAYYDTTTHTYDSVNADLTSTKCVWVCLIWEDNLSICNMVQVRDCECIPGPECPCDPRRCNNDSAHIIYIPGGTGTSAHEEDNESSISQNQNGNPVINRDTPRVPATLPVTEHPSRGSAKPVNDGKSKGPQR